MTDPGLTRRIEEIASQPSGGPAAAETLRSWLNGAQPFVPAGELARFAERAPVGLIVDSPVRHPVRHWRSPRPGGHRPEPD
jgi:hypothetical protein